MFFIAKKLIGTMLMPLQFSLVLIVVGVVLLWLNRSRRLAQSLVTAGALLLLIFSNQFVGYHVVHPLEARYPPIRLAQWGEAPVQASQTAISNLRLGANPLIVVLSGGASDDMKLPIADRLNPNSALRVVEAVEIYRCLSLSGRASKPGKSKGETEPQPSGAPRILLSGGATLNKIPEALPMKGLAESLGVPAKAILMEMRSDDTESEAENVLPIAGHKPFILVTSAFHMPRSMALFQHLGMRPIAAPSNYIGRQDTKPFLLKILPSTGALVEAETAWHEQLGMIWEHLRGQM